MASKVTVNVNPVANQYARGNERIIEFTTPEGGGLIAICYDHQGHTANVTAYRLDPTVTVQGQDPGAAFRDGG